jgi:hypothetical protein
VALLGGYGDQDGGTERRLEVALEHSPAHHSRHRLPGLRQDRRLDAVDLLASTRGTYMHVSVRRTSPSRYWSPLAPLC